MEPFDIRTYPADEQLFEELGLTKFARSFDLFNPAVTSGWMELGEVKREWATVKVEVSCMPAQFWRFTITSHIEDVQPGVIRTGSGALNHYWPFVEEWINGTLGYEPLT